MAEQEQTPPVVQKSRKRKKWMIGCLGLVGLLVLVGLCSTLINTDSSREDADRVDEVDEPERERPEEPDREPPTPPTLEVDARTLYAAYEANDIAAGDKYEDEEIIVTGTIESIGRDLLDDPYVALETDNMIGSVQCMLAKEERDKAAQLAKGQNIRLRGKVDGKLGNVIVRNCTILEGDNHPRR